MTIDSTKNVVDGVSVSVGVGAYLEYLPSIAALLTIIWTAIRIYETRTVQRLLGKEFKSEQYTQPTSD